MNEERAIAVIQALLTEYEREMQGVHLHRIQAYREAVLYLRERGVDYDSPEARRIPSRLTGTA